MRTSTHWSAPGPRPTAALMSSTWASAASAPPPPPSDAGEGAAAAASSPAASANAALTAARGEGGTTSVSLCGQAERLPYLRLLYRHTARERWRQPLPLDATHERTRLRSRSCRGQCLPRAPAGPQPPAGRGGAPAHAGRQVRTLSALAELVAQTLRQAVAAQRLRAASCCTHGWAAHSGRAFCLRHSPAATPAASRRCRLVPRSRPGSRSRSSCQTA